MGLMPKYSTVLLLPGLMLPLLLHFTSSSRINPWSGNESHRRMTRAKKNTNWSYTRTTPSYTRTTPSHTRMTDIYDGIILSCSSKGNSKNSSWNSSRNSSKDTPKLLENASSNPISSTSSYKLRYASSPYL